LSLNNTKLYIGFTFDKIQSRQKCSVLSKNAQDRPEIPLKVQKGM